MATKKTQQPMSLFDPRAMSAGFNMAYKAEIANAPASNANIATSNAKFFSNMLDKNTERFQKYLNKEKKEEEEENKAIVERAKPFTDGTVSNEQSESYMIHLNALEKEKVDGNYDKKGNEKKLMAWEQKYNRFLTGVQSTKNTLTSIVTMINAKEHIANGMNKKDRRALIAIGDLHTGKQTDNLDATQVIGDDGSVSYMIKDDNNTYTITEQQLKELVPIKDNEVKADIQGLFNDILTSSTSGEFGGEDVFENQQSTYNKIIDAIDGAKNSQHAYSTILDSKFGSMQKSFLEVMKDPTSEVFETILSTLKDEDLIEEFDELNPESNDLGGTTGRKDGVLNARDFDERNDPNGENLIRFIDAIKKDGDAGKSLVATYLSSVSANEEYELGKGKRKKTPGSTYKESAATKNARVTTTNLSQPNPPPVVTINNNQYKKIRYKQDIHGKHDGLVSGKDEIYTIRYSNGEQRFYTPFDLSNLYEGNEFNSKMKPISMGGFSIAPPEEEVPKKPGVFNFLKIY